MGTVNFVLLMVILMCCFPLTFIRIILNAVFPAEDPHFFCCSKNLDKEVMQSVADVERYLGFFS